MQGQLSIFDLIKDDLREWERFRDNYCKQQMAYRQFAKDEPSVKACCYKNEQRAKTWDDWQKCTYDNCPFMKGVCENE